MPDKIKVVLLFGGRSAEHDVSILSARSVQQEAPADRLQIIPICINRSGQFLDPAKSEQILSGGKAASSKSTFSFESWCTKEKPDVVFPIIHGTFGEDGSLQGYLEILGLPYVGSGVTASAVGMDKVHMKAAFKLADLPLVDYLAVKESEWRNERGDLEAEVQRIHLPLFVKPANAGSSVGVSKVKTLDELPAAIDKALRFDDKVLIEEGIDAREVEISVLGNENPEASVPGEIVAGREFYDYEDKYIEEGSSLVIPAELSEELTTKIRETAIAAFRAVGASGYSRVDFFVERSTERLYLNEINTIPGFTKISMYPKLWAASSLPYPQLIERLVALGIERASARGKRFDGMMRWFDEVKSLA